jgi:hypothetical protein
LSARDFGTLVGFCVWSKVDASSLGEGRHPLQVAFEQIQIEKERRCCQFLSRSTDDIEFFRHLFGTFHLSEVVDPVI